MLVVKIIRKIRLLLAKKKFKHFGTGSLLDLNTSYVVDKALVSIGKHVFIGPHAYISANLEIEDYVMLGPKVTLIGGNHAFGRVGERNRFLQPSGDLQGIKIKEDAWIGCNTTVLPNVTIGEGAVIGAGSVVNKDIPAYCLAVGNPATVKKVIFSDDEVQKHLAAFGRSEQDIADVLTERARYFEKNNLSCQLR